MVKVLVLFYSMYGHTYKMAKAVVEGAKLIPDTEVILKRVPELVPEKILEVTGAKIAQKQFEQIPIASVDELVRMDAIIIGTPTRFGNMSAQMRNFIDQTGPLLGKLSGKVGAVFVSTGSQHGGQETTIVTSQITLLHHGMIIIGLPPSFEGFKDTNVVSGGSVYGAASIVGVQGEKDPNENELAGARALGKRVAEITRNLFK